MGTREIVGATLLLCASVCSATTDVAIVQMNVGPQAYLYAPRRLAAAEPVWLQYPAPSGRTRCCIRLAGRAFAPVEADDAAANAQSGEPLFRYRFALPSRHIGRAPFVGIAIVGAALPVRQRHDNALLARAPGRMLVGRTCTSQEGVHVTGSTGARKVADLYLGLGYDIEAPSCKATPD